MFIWTWLEPTGLFLLILAQAMRTLSWKHTLGLVTMDVELADRTLSVAVTPVQAVVLLYFQDQGESLEPVS